MPWGWDTVPDTGHRGSGRGPEGKDGHCRADNPAMFMSCKLQEMFHIALIVLCLQTSTHTGAHSNLLKFPLRFPCTAIFPPGAASPHRLWAALCSAIHRGQVACTGRSVVTALGRPWSEMYNIDQVVSLKLSLI